VAASPPLPSLLCRPPQGRLARRERHSRSTCCCYGRLCYKAVSAYIHVVSVGAQTRRLTSALLSLDGWLGAGGGGGVTCPANTGFAAAQALGSAAKDGLTSFLTPAAVFGPARMLASCCGSCTGPGCWTRTLLRSFRAWPRGRWWRAGTHIDSLHPPLLPLPLSQDPASCFPRPLRERGVGTLHVHPSRGWLGQ